MRRSPPVWRWFCLYARVVTVQIRPHKTDGTIEIFRDLLPLMREQAGFRGAQLLADAASGRGQMTTLWESEAHMTANEASGWFREQITHFQPVLCAPPSAERYEVHMMLDARAGDDEELGHEGGIHER